MNEPLLSIIIPVYNGKSNGLAKCLDSIWQQPFDDYEVICVDDLSTDDTRQWLRAEPRLRLIENDENLRQGGARNRGVREARGTYILFIDQDDYYHPGALPELAKHLRTRELDLAVADNAVQFYGHESNEWVLWPPLQTRCTGQEWIESNGIAMVPWRVAIRRDYWLSHGLWFAERTRIEDLDWNCRILARAERVQYVPVLLVHYNKGDRSTTDTMAANPETLMANAQAATRVLAVAEELYTQSPVRNIVEAYADKCYNATCQALLGSAAPMSVKRSIIAQITPRPTAHRLVRLATKHPATYALTSTLAMPLYRLLRYLRRHRRARQRAAN